MSAEDDIKASHRQRGLNAMAEHLCSTDLTDGFCRPEIGKFMSSAAHCTSPAGRRDSMQNCVFRALGLVKAVESRGCSIKWDHDPGLGGSTRWDHLPADCRSRSD